MNIEEKDIITLSDNKEYSVVRIIELPSRKVYFITDLTDLNNQKYMYLESTDKLIEIEDENIINELKNIITNDTENINNNIEESIQMIDTLLKEE